MSAIIATAFVARKQYSTNHKYDDVIKINDHLLHLPRNIRKNPMKDLLPYLKAVEESGYESNKRRRVFVIGNTGKLSYCAIISQILPAKT